MKTHALFVPSAWLIPLLLAGCSGEDARPDVPATGSAALVEADAADLEISGPHRHANLQVWLVHGDSRLQSDREVVPLEEALERKLCVVHETGDVNELAIENVSPDVDVYVQSGDIVQGGQQDRTIGVDLVLAPKSGRVPLPSFCVEQGRWSARGGSGGQQRIVADLFASDIDPVAAQSAHVADAGGFGLFSSSRNSVATNELKKAVLLERDQGKVWQEVSDAQGMLASNAAGHGQVVDGSSPSSLELTLNTEAVQEATAAYVGALDGILAGQDDALGCVVAINGELYGADVYGSRQLFAQLWPKLLRGAATAAVARQQADGEPAVATTADARAFLASPRRGRDRREVGAGVSMGIVETERNHVVESRVGEGALVHRAYLAK